MPFHGSITPEQWMAISGALQNVGGMFGRPGQQGQGNQLMMQALRGQSERRKEQEFRDLLKGFASPTVRGPQYAGPPPAGPTNLVPPSSGGRVPVGSQLPGPSLQTQPGAASQVAPGALQPRINPQLLSLIGAMGMEKGLPLLAQQMAKEPRERPKRQDVNGRWRWVDTGKLVYPGVEKTKDPQYGEPIWDKRREKWYQLNPKTLKREWEKPGGSTLADRKGRLLDKWRAAQEGRGAWTEVDHPRAHLRASSDI